MKKVKITLFMTFCILLVCCSDVKSESSGEKNPTINPSVVPQISKSGTIKSFLKNEYVPNFISAKDLYNLMQKKEKVYIFDVRNKESYMESHITTSYSKPLPITTDMVTQFPKNSKIVTYCGCPHHLSTMGAEQLTNLGYKDVHVLNEGFWFWKDNKYPIEIDPNSKSKISELSVEGLLLKNGQPVSKANIYIKHEKSGQLEATSTDSKGYYKMNLRLYNYKDNDQFKFYVEDLTKPVQDFSTNQKISQNVIVNIK